MGRDLVIVVIARLLQIITTLVILRVMTYRLDPVELGKFSIITSLVMLFSLVFVNPAGMYINRHLHKWYYEGLVWKKFYYAFVYLLCVLILIVFLVPAGVLSYSPNWQISISWLLLIVCLSVASTTVNQTIIPSLNMLGERVAWAIYTLISLNTGLLLSWYLTIDRPNVEYWMLGIIGGNVIGVLLAILPFNSALKNNKNEISNNVDISFESLKGVLIFALPLSMTVGLNWVQFYSYRIMLAEMSTLDYLGLFAAGYAISAGIMNAFESIAQNYFYPLFYKKLYNTGIDKTLEPWKQYSKVMMPVAFLTAILICVMSIPLTKILLDQKYWGAAGFVALGAVLEFSRVIGNVYNMIGHALLNTRILLFPQLIGAISVVIFTPYMMRQYGNVGFSVGMVTASIIYLISLHTMLLKKVIFKISSILNNDLIYGIIVMLLMGGISITFSANESITYNLSILFIAGIVYIYFVFKVFKAIRYNKSYE